MNCIHRLVIATPFVNKSIVSYGLIVYALNTSKFVIVQRKHSVEFLLYMKGLYRLTHLPFLLSTIPAAELRLVKKSLDESYFRLLYSQLGFDDDCLDYALTRMKECHDYILNLITNLDNADNELSWTWPKGRLHVTGSERETPFSCAKREFQEEVEITLPPPIYVSKTYFTEIVQTLTGRNIESRYFFYVIPEEIPLSYPLSHPEVSNRQWVSIDECILTLFNGAFFDEKLQELLHSIPSL